MPISVEQTVLVINNIKPKKSSGFDNFSLLLLKASVHLLAKPTTVIINQSLSSGKFPSKLKIAKVFPICKHGDIHNFNNYRPISLLPSI